MFYRIFIYEGSNVSNTSYREEELEDDVFEEDNGDIFENEVILQLMLFFLMNLFIYKYFSRIGSLVINESPAFKTVQRSLCN